MPRPTISVPLAAIFVVTACGSSTVSSHPHPFMHGPDLIECPESPEFASARHGPPAPKPEVEVRQRRVRDRCTQARVASSRSPDDTMLARERTCACGQAGIVLFDDPERRFDREALELVDDACVHGYGEACSEGQIAGAFCNVHPAAICADLRAQGRVPDVDEQGAPQVTLPPSASGCFVVDRVAPCSASEGKGCSPAPSVGTAICFANQRISSRSPGASWDQVMTTWSGWLGAETFWSTPDATRLRIEPDGRSYGRAHLRPAPASIAREAAALPNVEDVCERTRTCASAVLSARPHIDEKEVAPPEGREHRDSLLKCLAELEAWRKVVSPPPRKCN